MSPELYGYISTFCLALCGLPLAISSVQKGHSEGVSRPFLWLWFFGEFFGLTYSFYLAKLPLIINYGFNLFIIVLVIYYSYCPRELDNDE